MVGSASGIQQSINDARHCMAQCEIESQDGDEKIRVNLWRTGGSAHQGTHKADRDIRTLTTTHRESMTSNWSSIVGHEHGWKYISAARSWNSFPLMTNAQTEQSSIELFIGIIDLSGLCILHNFTLAK